MANDNTVMLGAANMRERTRTSKSGTTTSRYTVEISGDTIISDLDPKSLGKPVADAIAQLLKERIQMIAAVASPGVQAARARARKAFDEGRQWAKRQYAGGRTGARAPNQTDRKFNDSGRLAEGIAVGANDDTFTVNFPANRWRPELVRGGVAGLQRMWEELKRLVPELADTARLMDSIPVRRTVQQGVKDAIVIAKDREVEAKRRQLELRRQVTSAQIAALKAIA